MTPATRWAFTGALLGALAAAVVFAPARWVAWALLQTSQGRVVLGHAQGTVWSGHAQVTLTGGPGSRDALTLPGQLSWKLDGSGGWGGLAARLTLRHPGLMPAPLVLRLLPGLGPWSLSLAEGTVPGKAEPTSGAAVLWPAAWLTALGTPWNTLQPSGLLRLSSPGFTLQMAPGGPRLQGSLVLEATDIASRLSTLPRLGSYRVVVAGTGAGSEAATVQLSTLDGALLLSGSGQWTGARLRLRGEARAAPGQEAALQNLLNLIGTRDGARSILSIG
ncbi:MAG: type II secretion system protein N [Rubrivivax sp.]|nr:type II secretion system protein N [Rubrivivax sp.]